MSASSKEAARETLQRFCEHVDSLARAPGSVRSAAIGFALETALGIEVDTFPPSLTGAMVALNSAYSEQKTEAERLSRLHLLVIQIREAVDLPPPEPTLPVELNLEESGWLCYLLLGRINAKQCDSVPSMLDSPDGDARIRDRMLLLYEKLAKINDGLMGKTS